MDHLLSSSMITKIKPRIPVKYLYGPIKYLYGPVKCQYGRESNCSLPVVII